MNRLVIVVSALSMVALTGCESLGTAAQSKTNQGAVLGGLLGAGAGAIIGNQTRHHAGAGTAIGAALGALGGGLLGNGLEEQNRAVQRQAFPPAMSTSASTGQAKFCPAGGELYPASMKYCPLHGAELRYKEQPEAASPPANFSTTQTAS